MGGRGGGDHEFFLPQYANGTVAGPDAQLEYDEGAAYDADVKSFALADDVEYGEE